MSFRVLSGGDGTDGVDPHVHASLEAAMAADRIQSLADSFNGIPEGMLKRRYAEFVAAGMGRHQAIVTVWPQLANEPSSFIAAKLKNLGRDPRVRDYIEAIQQHGGLSASFAYQEWLERMEFEVDNPNNPPGVRKDLLIALGEHYLRNGAAEAAGYQGTGKAVDKGREAGPLPGPTGDLFLDMLATEVQIPVEDDAPAAGAAGSR